MYRSLHRRQHRRQAAIDTSKGGSDRRAREFDVPTGTARPLLTVVTVIEADYEAAIWENFFYTTRKGAAALFIITENAITNGEHALLGSSG